MGHYAISKSTSLRITYKALTSLCRVCDKYLIPSREFRETSLQPVDSQIQSPLLKPRFQSIQCSSAYKLKENLETSHKWLHAYNHLLMHKIQSPWYKFFWKLNRKNHEKYEGNPRIPHWNNYTKLKMPWFILFLVILWFQKRNLWFLG